MKNKDIWCNLNKKLYKKFGKRKATKNTVIEMEKFIKEYLLNKSIKDFVKVKVIKRNLDKYSIIIETINPPSFVK